MKRSLLMAAAAALLASATAAQAQQRGLYGELRGGAAFLTDADVTDFAGFDGTVSSDVGYLVEGAIGYAHGSGARGELAVGYRQNDFDDFDVPSVGTAAVDGDLSALTVMGNVYYDFNLGGAGSRWSGLTPFVGGGIGTAFMNAVVDSLGGSPVGSDEDDTVFAWQVMAGLAYDVSPDIAATVSYTYFATSDAEFDGVGFEYASHNILAGIRFSY